MQPPRCPYFFATLPPAAFTRHLPLSLRYRHHLVFIASVRLLRHAAGCLFIVSLPHTPYAARAATPSQPSRALCLHAVTPERYVIYALSVNEHEAACAVHLLKPARPSLAPPASMPSRHATSSLARGACKDRPHAE
jgi:hypothetical protein